MSLYRLRAANYRALGDAERAAADSRTARALTPDDGFNLNELAWKMLRGTPARFDPATALELAERAANLVPGEAVCLNTLGVAQYYNGLYAKASATLERSLALGAGQSDAFDLFYLALAHHKLGNVTQSRDCYRRAIEWRCSHGNLSLALAQELKSIEGEVEEVLCLPEKRR
jgi:tetratricopeptide (TPR) repeat protein